MYRATAFGAPASVSWLRCRISRAVLGQYAPVPPHLKPLAGDYREAGDLWWRLSAGAAPSGLLDLAAALVDLASRLNCCPDSAYDAARVAELAVPIVPLRALGSTFRT